MTHEFIDIISAYKTAHLNGLKCVLATVVDLDGSSYRKPGVRMLISEKGQMTGAISGGCVEKEIKRQSTSVFKTKTAKIMTYDGRYRLGCEGLIYILIESFEPNQEFLNFFSKTIESRTSFTIESHYSKNAGSHQNLGSIFYFFNTPYPLNHTITTNNHYIFKQVLPPNFRILLFGYEHDAVELCKFSSMCGWDVEIFSSSPEIEHLHLFSSAKTIHHIQSDEIKNIKIDKETALVLMTHNFAKDLSYLLELSKHSNYPNYIGVIGSKKRMSQLESALFEHLPNINEEFLDLIHGPAGLKIGSITPQEIAISILSEITQAVRMPSPIFQN